MTNMYIFRYFTIKLTNECSNSPDQMRETIIFNFFVLFINCPWICSDWTSIKHSLPKWAYIWDYISLCLYLYNSDVLGSLQRWVKCLHLIFCGCEAVNKILIFVIRITCNVFGTLLLGWNLKWCLWHTQVNVKRGMILWRSKS